jgi:hypothetical protein
MAETLNTSVVESVANTNFKVLAEIPAQIAAMNLQAHSGFILQMQQLAFANTTVGLDRIYSLTLEDAKAANELMTGNAVAGKLASLKATE